MKIQIFTADQNNNIKIVNSDIREDLLLQKGIYDVVRFVRKNAALYLTAHIERFINSADLEGINFDYSFMDIKNLMIDCLKNIKFEEFRVKIFYVCGNEKIDKGLFFVFEDLTELMKTMKLKRELGVTLGTYQLERLIPESKSIEWLNLRVKIKNDYLSDYDEGLLVNDQDEILEGLSSNFFYIRNNKVYTADKNILNGVTRQILLDKMDIEPGFLNTNDIKTIDEAFITSTSRGVLPVNSINGIKIGAIYSQKSEKALSIANNYEKWLDDYLEIIEL